MKKYDIGTPRRENNRGWDFTHSDKNCPCSWANVKHCAKKANNIPSIKFNFILYSDECLFLFQTQKTQNVNPGFYINFFLLCKNI